MVQVFWHWCEQTAIELEAKRCSSLRVEQNYLFGPSKRWNTETQGSVVELTLRKVRLVPSEVYLWSFRNYEGVALDWVTAEGIRARWVNQSHI